MGIQPRVGVDMIIEWRSRMSVLITELALNSYIAGANGPYGLMYFYSKKKQKQP